jgi:hypothetical protein
VRLQTLNPKPEGIHPSIPSELKVGDPKPEEIHPSIPSELKVGEVAGFLSLCWF